MLSPFSQCLLLLIAALFTAWSVALCHERKSLAAFAGRFLGVWRGWPWSVRVLMSGLLVCCTLAAQKPSNAASRSVSTTGTVSAAAGTTNALPSGPASGGESARLTETRDSGSPAIAQWWLDENRDPADSDSDGLPDEWERLFGTGPDDPGDAALDRDGDGLDELAEFANRCHPLRRDTDGDGMDDAFEIANGLCPWRPDDTADADGDGLDNFHEMVFGTDVNSPDSNGDGRTDGEEAAEGVDPSLASPGTEFFGTAVFRIRVAGTAAARRAAVRVGHILHTGVAEREYAIAAGDRYDVRVIDLEPGNANVCTGAVLLTSVAGLSLEGFDGSFTLPLTNAAAAAYASAGSGVSTLDADGEEDGGGLSLGGMTAVGLVLDTAACCFDCGSGGSFSATAVVVPEGLGLAAPSYSWLWSAGSAFPQTGESVTLTTDENLWDGADGGVLSCTFSASGVAPVTVGQRIWPAAAYTNENTYEEPYVRCVELENATTNVYAMRGDTSPVTFEWAGWGTGNGVVWTISPSGGSFAHFIDASGHACSMLKNVPSVSVLPGGSALTYTIRATTKKPAMTRTVRLSVMDLNFEPVTPPGTGDTPVNPGGLAAGNDAWFRATGLLNITGDKLNWSCGNGHAQITGPASGDQVRVHAVSEGDAAVGIDIDGYVGPRPSANLHVFPAVSSEVPVRAFIVCFNDGSGAPVTPQGIGERIALANTVFLQAGVRFSLASVGVVSNTNWRSASSIGKQTNLVNFVTNGNTLEIYYVYELTYNTQGINYPGGAIIMGSAPLETTAHELGHTLGLGDIYVSDEHTSLHVELGAKAREKWLPNDWSAFYVEDLTQATLLMRLLMFSNGYRTGTDISSGPVYGLRYDWVPVSGGFQKVFVVDANGAVGLNSIANRSPVHY